MRGASFGLLFTAFSFLVSGATARIDGVTQSGALK